MAISATLTQLVINGAESPIASIDIDGDVTDFATNVNGTVAYTYAWGVSNGTLNANDLSSVQVTPSNAGNVALTLVVNDGVTDSPQATSNTNALSGNVAPTLTITTSTGLTVDAGATIALNAVVSDTLGDTHTYLWSSGDTTSSISFTAPIGASNTTITRTCVATDEDDEDSNIAGITINVNAEEIINAPPTVTISPNQSVGAGATVLIQAFGNDPDGDPLTYAFTEVTNTGVTLIGSGTTRTFTAPTSNADTQIIIGVTASDGSFTSSRADTVVTVAAQVVPNTAPEVLILGQSTGDTNDTFTLSASITDPDADTHTFAWRLISGEATLSALDSPFVTVMPSQAETITVGLIVNDGEVNSLEDTFVITVSDAVANDEVFAALSKVVFTTESSDIISAFVGRANLQKLQFKVEGDLRDINTINENFDFDSNSVSKIEVRTELGSLSSELGGVTFKDDELLIEFGLLVNTGTTTPRIIIYIGGDQKGLVISGPNMPASPVLFMYEALESLSALANYSISGNVNANVGDTVLLSSIVNNATQSTSYLWRLISGGATMPNTLTTSTIEIIPTSTGDIIIGLSVDNGSEVTHTIASTISANQSIINITESVVNGSYNVDFDYDNGLLIERRAVTFINGGANETLFVPVNTSVRYSFILNGQFYGGNFVTVGV